MHVSLLAVSALGALAGVGRSLREAFYMFWDTLWALVLGFGISGAVQAFVSREAMQRRLGDRRARGMAATDPTRRRLGRRRQLHHERPHHVA